MTAVAAMRQVSKGGPGRRQNDPEWQEPTKRGTKQPSPQNSMGIYIYTYNTRYRYIVDIVRDNLFPLLLKLPQLM